MKENQDISVLTDEEKLLKEENIPGLTICNQDIEIEILEQLNKHFDEIENETCNLHSEEKSNNTEKLSTILINDVENETECERKIRLGEMTPFGTVLQSKENASIKNEESQIFKYLKQQEELKKNYQIRNLTYSKIKTTNKITPRYKKKKKKKIIGTDSVDYCNVKNYEPLLSEKISINFNQESGSEYFPSSEDVDSSDDDRSITFNKKRKKRKRKIIDDAEGNSDEYVSDFDAPSCNSKQIKINASKELDDGDESEYQNRLRLYEKSFDSTDILFYELDNCNIKIPLEIWTKLYNYQNVGVQWLCELHQQGVGGILADEMGLGKTIQIISFLSGLYYSKLKNKYSRFRGLGSSLIICPTTLMHQWVKEFHLWLPPLRVAILHACGSFLGRKQNLIRDIYRNCGVLITSYVGMVQCSDELLRYNWHYIILDEGHKIRNPDAKVTLTVKQFKTPHRIILSGSPLQNNLEELWSLFDFIYPGKLGSLPLFQSQFAIPITHGGYANASDVEVTIAYKCATVLKDLISPYLLRRSKHDVKSHINLPQKNEQILFCQLTDIQRNLYKSYLGSGDVHRILEGELQIFTGLINLRKICNHPDLYTERPKFTIIDKKIDILDEDKYGYWEKSGKMIVLKTLLKIWHKQNHRVLLFTQSKKMLDILEIFLSTFNYTYLKMDGSTYIGSRQPLINTFNSDPNYFIMLLTTKVGGLGINLTGANRIVIFDPDWNPATDTQARERAWRIGQTQDVTIYRLISVGTIEEKIYHRQIFKQFLTNKVLKDPKQRRFFKSNSLFELFTLKESNKKGSTETGAIFAGTGSEINLDLLKLKNKIKKKQLKEKKNCEELSSHFSKSKIEKMKQIAQRISRKLSHQIDVSKQTSIKSLPTNSENKCDRNVENNTLIYDLNFSPQNPNNKNLNHNITGSSFTFQCNKIDIKSNVDGVNKCCINTSSSSDEKVKEDNPMGSRFQNKLEKNTLVTTKKHKKKHNKSVFEGEYVPYLISSKKSKITNSEEESDIVTVEDEYVLKKLFSKAGICSALQHDTIMEGGPADFAIIENEAKKIAEEALNELKRSQELCFSAHSGIPNWTGKHGYRSRNSAVNSKVLSSNDILEKIKKRNGILDSVESETQILNELKNFISSEGGTASTDRLIENFQNQLPASKTPLFKNLLNQICSFYRGLDKKGYWTLKTEFLNR